MRILFRIAIVLLLTVGARADSFDFTFESQRFTVSGTFYGNLVSPGVYFIGGLTGTINPGKEPPLNELNYVYPGEFNGVLNNDNLLFTKQPYVDSYGISFFAGNIVYYDLIHDQFGYAVLSCGISPCTGSNILRTPGSLEVSPVPEPPSLLLIASGITLLGTQIKRMRLRRAESGAPFMARLYRDMSGFFARSANRFRSIHSASIWMVEASPLA
jgi:hypothetical protein